MASSLLVANGFGDGEGVGDKSDVVLHGFDLFFLEQFAVELIAQAEGHHHSADFAPVAIAQQVAAVAFERIVFEDIDLGRQMGFGVEIDLELIAVVYEADDVLGLSVDVGVGQAAQSFLRCRGG